MRPQPGSYEGGRFRFGAAIAALGLSVVALAGCGEGDVAKAAGSGPSKGTYVNGSSPEEYCSVLESLKAGLSADVEADTDAALATIYTINDIEPLAPEETKADWAGLKLIMQAVVDAKGADTVGSMTRAEAGVLVSDLSGRVSESVSEICGFPLS